jgi:hypothetical protein
MASRGVKKPKLAELASAIGRRAVPAPKGTEPTLRQTSAPLAALPMLRTPEMVAHLSAGTEIPRMVVWVTQALKTAPAMVDGSTGGRV